MSSMPIVQKMEDSMKRGSVMRSTESEGKARHYLEKTDSPVPPPCDSPVPTFNLQKVVTKPLTVSPSSQAVSETYTREEREEIHKKFSLEKLGDRAIPTIIEEETSPVHGPRVHPLIRIDYPGITNPCLKVIYTAEQRQTKATIGIIACTLATLFLLMERLGLRPAEILTQMGGFPSFISVLPLLCMAFICWARTPSSELSRTGGVAHNGQVYILDIYTAFLKSYVNPKMLDLIKKSVETHSRFTKHAIRSFILFALSECVSCYSMYSPFLNTPGDFTSPIQTTTNPVIFGPTPEGVPTGFSVYSVQNEDSRSLGYTLHAFLPCVALALHIAALTCMITANTTDDSANEAPTFHFNPVIPPSAIEDPWFVSRKAKVFVLLPLFLAALFLLHSFTRSDIYPPTLLYPNAHADATCAFCFILYRFMLTIVCGLVALALSSSITRLASRYSQRNSKIMGLLSALILATSLCITVFVICDATTDVESSSNFISYMRNGPYIQKILILTAHTLQGVGLFLFCCSCASVGFHDVLVTKATANGKIDEEKDITSHHFGVQLQINGKAVTESKKQL